MPPNVNVNAAERDFIRQVHEAALRGDRIQARQFQFALEVLTTTHEIAELLDTNPDYKGNFCRALTNDRCDDRHGRLNPEMLADLCPLDNGWHDDGEHAFGPRSFSLVSLDILPAEILQDILVERVDLATLTTLRRINRSLRRSFYELLQYRSIITQVPAALRAALSLEVASSFTCRVLYTALSTWSCYNCRKFGAYLYVPTCMRLFSMFLGGTEVPSHDERACQDLFVNHQSR